MPKTTTDDGVWKLPDGDAFYAYKLHLKTRPQRSSQTKCTSLVCARWRASKARCEQFSTPTVLPASANRRGNGQARERSAFSLFERRQRRAAALAEYTRADHTGDGALVERNCFSLTPQAKSKSAGSEFKEATAPGAYYEPGAMDGNRPGIFFANLRDMNEVPKWSMPTLAYHEGVPGTSLAAFDRAGTERCSTVSQSAAVHRLCRRLGALLRMAGETSRLVRKTIRLAISGRFRDELFRAVRSGRRYRHSCETLDPRTSDRLHARENRHGRKGS